MAKQVGMEFAFFEFLRSFYLENKGAIRNRYREITKKYLDYNDKEKNPEAFLRKPQFEALEMYVFIKEFMNNAQMYQIFDDWSQRKGVFAERRFYDEQGQMPLYRRIPKRGFKCRNSKEIVGINLSALEVFEDGATVSVETLIESGIVKNPRDGVKILGNGELTKKLTVQANAFSAKAAEKIEALGGKAEVI